jgi:poly(A) polymerase
MTKAYLLAKSIVQKLAEHGYVAYFAGGWVRDFILKHPSEDIDIATNASPEDIQKIFPHTIPIGIAFGIILIVLEEHQFEVATFRRDLEYKDGRRPSAVEYTTPLEDAKRRDFTINGMFYDPLKEQILDYVGGKLDLDKKILRAIGNPHERIKEDRLRMIRAVRFACRFDLQIDPETENAIHQHCKELFPAVAVERIWQELNKMAKQKSFSHGLKLLYEFGLLQEIFLLMDEKHFHDLDKKLQIIYDLPLHTYTIVKILELFKPLSLEEQLRLCLYFKLSKEEQEFVTFLDKMEKMFFKDNISDYELAHFFAHSSSKEILEILISKIPFHEQKAFMKRLQEKQKQLEEEINRIQRKCPIVTSHMLMKEGIKPSKKLGSLLELAEKIAINEKIKDPEQIIAQLKQSNLWSDF